MFSFANCQLPIVHCSILSNFSKIPAMKKNLWILVLAIIAVASVVIVYLLRSPDKTRTVYCGPDNTDPAIVYKDPQDAFPSFATGYNVKLEAGVNLMDTLNKAASDINAGSEIQTEIVELREKLNQDNIRMQELMKSCFLAYHTRPCNPDASKRYYDMLDTLISRITKLEELKASVVEPEKVEPQPKDTATPPSTQVISKDTARLKRELFQFNRRYTPMKLSDAKLRQP